MSKLYASLMALGLAGTIYAATNFSLTSLQNICDRMQEHSGIVSASKELDVTSKDMRESWPFSSGGPYFYFKRDKRISDLERFAEKAEFVAASARRYHSIIQKDDVQEMIREYRARDDRNARLFLLLGLSAFTTVASFRTLVRNYRRKK